MRRSGSRDDHLNEEAIGQLKLLAEPAVSPTARDPATKLHCPQVRERSIIRAVQSEGEILIVSFPNQVLV